ncbi:hypothetical protein ACWD5R_11530 [Streptomyces sp. NPDC002514]|uniref:hypothetical protein n=1 Tax=Streptomyces sp. NPDC001270 TaxID=3364554 RepID=UPI0036AD1419
MEDEEPAENSTAERMTRAAQSAGRAAGYCYLEHPLGNRFCTRRPHTDSLHIDYYRGRESAADTQGISWCE